MWTKSTKVSPEKKKELERPGPEAIKPFSCSTQLNMKFQLLIKTKMLKSKLSDVEFIHCWCFDIDEQDKFLAQFC